jgi:hypothetical protein
MDVSKSCGCSAVGRALHGTPAHPRWALSTMSPLEFIQRLAALVPRPRLHLIRFFYSVLAPDARLRREIIPNVPVQRHCSSADHGDAPLPWRLPHEAWARLLTKPPGAVFNGECRPAGRKPGRAL